MPEPCSDTELLWLLSGASGRKTVEKGVPGAGSLTLLSEGQSEHAEAIHLNALVEDSQMS